MKPKKFRKNLLFSPIIPPGSSDPYTLYLVHPEERQIATGVSICARFSRPSRAVVPLQLRGHLD